MILKKLAPDLIQGGYRSSEKIMLQQEAGAGYAPSSSTSKSSRFEPIGVDGAYRPAALRKV